MVHTVRPAFVALPRDPPVQDAAEGCGPNSVPPGCPLRRHAEMPKTPPAAGTAAPREAMPDSHRIPTQRPATLRRQAITLLSPVMRFLIRAQPMVSSDARRPGRRWPFNDCRTTVPHRTGCVSSQRTRSANGTLPGEAARRVTEEHGVLTCRESLNHLWAEYRTTRHKAARNALVEVYMPLVHKQARWLSRRLPHRVGAEDLCSAGYEGLIQAVEAFDVARNARFETFCQKRILGAMHDWLRTMSVHSRTVQTFLTRRSGARSALSVAHGRRATDEEVADDMGIRHSRFAYLSRIARHGQEVQMSVLRKGHAARCRGDADEASWDPVDPNPVDPASAIQRQLFIKKVTHGLSREERLIITLYYCEGLTFSDIGVILALSESRVSQIHSHLVERLRVRLANDPETCERGLQTSRGALSLS